MQPHPSDPWLPAWTHVGVAGQGPACVVLHGILGSGRNLRGFAQLLGQQLPAWQFLLVDLRHHGQSAGAPPPDDLDACVADLRRLCAALGVHPAAVVGHSFGGKVAMQWMADPPPSLRALAVLDTQPHLQAHEDDSPAAARRMLALLRAVPQPLASRQDLANHLHPAGIDAPVVQWLQTNLHAADGGYRWKFDLDGVGRLLDSYYATDSWPRLRQCPPQVQVLVVRAGRSDRWTPPVLAGFAQLPAQVRLRELPNAGHWLHVDDPAGLAALLVPHLAGAFL